MRTRREILRRHRRERQFLVFGLLVVLLAAIATIALGVYQGRVVSPFAEPIYTPPPDYQDTATLACAPRDEGNGENMPLPADQVPVRVLNGTDQSGLARGTLDVLVGRGYVSTGATNWNLTYSGAVRIQFGVDGLRGAYTVARNFPTVEYVLDSRQGAVVDIILGEQFETSDIRPAYAPELDDAEELAGPVNCVPVDRAQQVPAPRIIPVDPLAPSESASPSPTPAA